MTSLTDAAPPATLARHAGPLALGAGVFPMAAALGLVVAGLVAFRSSFPPYGVPLGLVVAGLGAWLIRSDRGAPAASR